MDNFDVTIFLDDVFQGYRCHVIPSSLRITREKIVQQARVVRLPVHVVEEPWVAPAEQVLVTAAVGADVPPELSGARFDVIPSADATPGTVPQPSSRTAT